MRIAKGVSRAAGRHFISGENRDTELQNGRVVGAVKRGRANSQSRPSEEVEFSDAGLNHKVLEKGSGCNLQL